jgi:hypothetical protein
MKNLRRTEPDSLALNDSVGYSGFLQVIGMIAGATLTGESAEGGLEPPFTSSRELQPTVAATIRAPLNQFRRTVPLQNRNDEFHFRRTASQVLTGRRDIEYVWRLEWHEEIRCKRPMSAFLADTRPKRMSAYDAKADIQERRRLVL